MEFCRIVLDLHSSAYSVTELVGCVLGDVSRCLHYVGDVCLLFRCRACVCLPSYFLHCGSHLSLVLVTRVVIQTPGLWSYAAYSIHGQGRDGTWGTGSKGGPC